MSRSVRQNARSNFMAGIVPALVLLATTPVLVRGLGTADYGLLIVVTSVAGYMAVLDVNVTAGSVKFIAEAQARGDRAAVCSTFSFGLMVYGFIAGTGALTILVAAPWLAHWFATPGQVASDQASTAFRVAALGFALGQVYSYLLSVPQALQRYDLSGRIEMTLGVLAPSVTAAAVALGAHLTGVIWLRNLVAIVGMAWLVVVVRRALPWLQWSWPGVVLRRQLMGFSAYAYLARLAAITYQHADKLVIASVLDVKSVAVYTVPVILANRLFATTYRITQVIFPASSALLEQGRQAEVLVLLLRSTRLVFAVNAGVVVMLWLLGSAFLHAWVGPDFVGAGYGVLVLVSCGALADSLTNGPSLVTDGSGRPDVTGRLAVIRAGVGLAALLAGAKLGGVFGVALSHLLVSVCFAAFFVAFFAARVFPLPLVIWFKASVLPGLGMSLAGLGCGWLAVVAVGGGGVKAALAGGTAASVVMAGVGWRLVLVSADRAALRAALRRGKMA